uniref:GNAT family N-acetyltransferase n=1 Tax=Agathobacter sp. TaxID=2021311 RepID=UPI0040576BE5
MEHKGTVRLETERLVLRQFQADDAKVAFRNWMSDDKVTEFLRWPTHKDVEVSKSVMADWMEEYEKDKAFYQWAIVPKDLNEPIGTISVVDKNEKTDTVHIGYCIGSKWWKNGYVSEAFAGIIPFFFEEVKAKRIEAQHDPNNPNSGKVMQKCGLVYEGTLRKADWSNKGIVDAAMYALLAEDYLKVTCGEHVSL